MTVSTRLLRRVPVMAGRLCLHLSLAIILVLVCAGLSAQERDDVLAASQAGAEVKVPSTSGASAPRGESPRTDSTRSSAPRADSSGSPAPKPGETVGTVDLRIALPAPGKQVGETAGAVRIVLALTLLAVLPSLLVCLSSFLRIVIVLSMLRHAIGMPETPPNTVVIGLALFLTLFTMNPILQQLNHDAVQPFMAGDIGVEQGVERAAKPLRQFMLQQTREQDLALMVELSKSPRPQSINDVGNLQLIPAFMLSELRAAFQIGFVIFLPFLLIDLIVSSILMSLGMMMMPPVTLALPIKILMFILVDGWGVIVKALVTSFH